MVGQRANGPRSKLRVLHLVNDLQGAGAQHVILALAGGLERSRFEPIVATWGGRKDLLPHFDSLGVQVIDCGARGRCDVRALWRVYRSLKRLRVDILHTHLFRMHIAGRVLGKLAGVPWIISTHHNLWQSNHPMSRLCEAFTTPCVDVVIAASRAAEASYFATSTEFRASWLRSARRHFTIYNGVDVAGVEAAVADTDIERKRVELGLDSRFVFACVARLHPCKGHMVLLAAANSLQDDRPGVTILLLGSGPMRQPLEREVRRRNLQDSVRILGHRDDVYEVLAASDAFVAPSLMEGFGLAIAEAMAASLPVVSTDIPAVQEVVQHQETGLLVPPRDPAALADAMSTIMSNPEQARKYGAAGKKRVKEMFPTEVMVRQYKTLYGWLTTDHQREDDS